MGDVRRSAVRRGRLPLALVVAASLVGVTAAVSGAAPAPPGVRFAQAGHWFASPSEDLVYHVNGAAGTVDARARVDGIEAGSQVVQGDTVGYVVGGTQILEFGKSTLTVEQTLTAPAGERPVALEARGGPYLVYRETGTVVRLGAEPRTIPAGTPLGEPVVTPDGTLWLHRTDTNVFCRLRPGADVLSCAAAGPPGHTGALTVVGDRAVFVDTEADTLSPITDDGLGRSTPAGVDLPADAGVAAADVQGRVAVLDPGQHRMHLVDASGVGSGRAAAAPVPVNLPAGRYATPSAGRSSVVLLDQQNRSVLTYDRDGRRQGVTEVPPESGDPRLSRGQDDRVYVEGGEGRQVLVVDDRGRARSVPPAGAGMPPSSQAPGSRAPRRPPGGPATPPARNAPVEPPVTAGRPAGPGQPRSGTTPPRRTPDTTTTAAPEKTRAVPASPPGLPPRARARVSGDTIVVSWGAAAANGATVTGYRVTWTPSGGSSKSSAESGGSRSATLTGLTRGVAYRITVAAQNSAGRGPAATVRATVPKPPAPSRTLTVARGEGVDHASDCMRPRCAYFRVTMRGFKPNTAYDIEPYSSRWGHFNSGARLTTDGDGNLTTERFAFGGVGQTVWVEVDGLQSNRLVWTTE